MRILEIRYIKWFLKEKSLVWICENWFHTCDKENVNIEMIKFNALIFVSVESIKIWNVYGKSLTKWVSLISESFLVFYIVHPYYQSKATISILKASHSICWYSWP